MNSRSGSCIFASGSVHHLSPIFDRLDELQIECGSKSSGGCRWLVDCSRLCFPRTQRCIDLYAYLCFFAGGGVGAWAVYFLSGFGRAAIKGWHIPLCILLALGFSMVLPAPIDGRVEVRIQATGQKNPASHASEVFVRGLPEMRDAVIAGNWERRDNVYVYVYVFYKN